MNTSVDISETTLRNTIAKFTFLDPEDIGVTSDFGDDLGLDSLDRFELLAEIEERHDVLLPDELLTKIWNLGDLVKALEPAAGDLDS